MRPLKIYTLIFVACAASFTGCSKNNGGEPGDDYINLASSIAISDDQISENNFDPGDGIGLFVVPYVGGQPGTIGVDNYATNSEFIYNGSGWSPAEGGRLPWPGNSTLDIYAYYPYDDAMDDPSSYLFRVNSDQSTQAGYDGSDFLLAVSEGITPRSDIPLIFYHKLSRININVDAEVAGDPGQTAVEVEIYDMLPSATVDLGSGSVSVVGTGGRINITPLYSEMDDDDEYSDCFSAIVPPQTIATGTRLLRITIDDTDYFYRTTDDITLQQGSTLTFNIAVTQLGISVSVDQINQWMEGGTVEGNIGERAPRVLDLSEIDWNDSYVHDIYYRNTLIGQVCREYLFINNGNINAQAIVVYPMGTNGEPNLAAGFVPQVMNRDRNANTNEYEPNTSSVHGGSVVFGGSNNLVSYSPGNSSLVELVQIVSSNEVVAAATNAAVILEVRPRYVTDVDGNRYSLVKIGTQYWTAENAKTEHYSDGSPLEVFWYNDDRSYKESYGGFYTWPTTVDGRGIAPDGWRVPERSDWTDLFNYLTPNAGGKLKSNTLWSNLSYGDNVTGFNGLPLGRRSATGVWEEYRNYAQWWSQTSADANTAYRLYLDFGNYAMHDTTLNKNYTQNIRFVME